MFVLGLLHIRTATGRLRVMPFICLKETRNSNDDKGSSVPPYPKEFVVLVFVKSAVLYSRGITDHRFRFICSVRDQIVTRR